MFQVEFTPSPRVLKGLDEIAGYLRISRRTACRWVHQHALPAMQSPAGTYITTTSLIDLWIIAVTETQRGWKIRETPSVSLDEKGGG
jgi:excisionase family DNA binding protein